MRSLLRHIRTLLSLRWQIPLAVCAAALAGMTLLRLRPPPAPVNVDAVLADVLAMEQAGAYRDAIDSAANLLELKPPLAKAQRAAIHRLIGELLYRLETQRRTPLPDNLTRMLEHEADAVALGAPDASEMRMRLAWAHEWLRDSHSAAEQYRAALLLDPTPDEQREARMSLVKLLQFEPAAAAERAGYLRDLMLDQGVSPHYVTWALYRGVGDALDRQDVAGARALIDTFGERLRNSDLRGYLEYLNAAVLVADRRFDEAAPLVNYVDEWLASNSREESRVEQVTPLPALNRWLSGTIALNEERPQAALADFESALARLGARDAVPRDAVELFARASISRARALAALRRHDDARNGLLADVKMLRRDVPDPHHAILAMRLALVDLFNDRYDAAEFDDAIGYMRAATALAPQHDRDDDSGPAQAQLLERLANAHGRAADDAEEATSRTHHHEQAGQYFEQAADAQKLNEQRYADLTWEAARHYDAAGAYASAERSLRAFTNGRAADARMPAALLQLGNTLEAAGKLSAANEAYDEIARRFPRLAEAKRATLQSANCLLALGGEQSAAAQEKLEALLRDDTLTPSATIYRDALLAVCDLLYLNQHHADAISRLENFLTLYPDDPARKRARFMLADVYRRSALELRDNPPTNVPAERAREESRQRLRAAATHFDALQSELDAAPPNDGADPETDLYRRLALAYRGDCLFELNAPDTLNEALATYRQIAARYEEEPAALNAQVQIANIYLRQGRVIEASRAVERARWLLRNMPDQNFTTVGDGQSRADWDRYLTTVAASNLLAGAVDAGRDARPSQGAFP